MKYVMVLYHKLYNLNEEKIIIGTYWGHYYKWE